MKRIHNIILLLFLAFFIGFGVSACTMREIYVDAITARNAAAVEQTAQIEAPETPADVDADAPAVEEQQMQSLEIIATAYCPCVKCCGKTDGITATGTKATAGRTIAVDPDVIPYGTEVIINGHTYVAEDCGGAINGNDIDVFFNTHEEALQFGRQVLTAYYYE